MLFWPLRCHSTCNPVKRKSDGKPCNLELKMKSLIGNKSAEKDIRDWLISNGHFRKSAKFAEIELHAIKRPGWLQIFRFHFMSVTAENESLQLFGAMRSDERYGKPNIVIHEDVATRDAQLAEWSEGLITQRRRRS